MSRDRGEYLERCPSMFTASGATVTQEAVQFLIPADAFNHIVASAAAVAYRQLANTLQDDRQFLGVNDVATVLGVSSNTVTRLADDGHLTCIDVGTGGQRRTRRFLRADVNAFIESSTVTMTWRR